MSDADSRSDDDFVILSRQESDGGLRDNSGLWAGRNSNILRFFMGFSSLFGSV